MKLSRDKIQRMIDVGSGGSSGGVSSSELAGLLAGYATETWVDEHYISIDFFSRLFQAHGTENGSEIDVMPNDMDTTITSVESMFGFWTNLYISALGSNGAAPAGISLGMLTDVAISGTPSAGQVLTYDVITQKWVNGNAQAGATALANLTDVTLTSLQGNQILIYDANTQKWVNSSVKTINGYSIFGTGDIPASGGGGGNYLPLAGGQMTGDNPINFVSNKIAIDFRSYHELYDAKVEYMSAGNEALVFSNKNAMTSYIFKCGYQLTNSNEWRNLTPSVQIKKQSLYINELIPDGVDPYWKFYVYGTAKVNGWCEFMDIRVEESNEINSYSTSSMIHLNYRRGGGISMCYNGGNVAIGNIPQSGIKFYVNGDGKFTDKVALFEWLQFTRESWNYISVPSNGKLGFCIGKSGTDYTKMVVSNSGDIGVGTISPSYKLHVAGTIYATGSITALSDARKKDITGKAGVTVEQIAHAPAVQFLWKDKERRKDGQQVGTLAQYWRTVLPEVVSDKGGELSMQYGVAALVSAIVTARKVVDHERRITELEKENERLKEEVEQLRLN